MDRSGGGVRYITEDLVLRMAKADSLDGIYKLNLTLSREGGKKIRYIENLEKCKSLQSLNLSCNIIEKIEKLDRLTRLRELNLSHNLLTRLDGLEALVNLQHLDVSSNNIAVIPPWLPKRLKALQVFRIGNNAIESLGEVTKLRPLSDLVQLTVAENPLCRLPHHRLFVVFHLGGLEFLDGARVEEAERDAARVRFGQEEVERLTSENEVHARRIRELEQRQGRAESDARVRSERERELHRKQRVDIERISQLERELEAKDNLLKTKTDELTRACHKHYELEQELAFYKIDAKFDSLGQPPVLDGEQLDPSEGTGESPYIGKGRVAKVRYPGAPGPARPAAMAESATSPVDGDDPASLAAKQRLSNTLDRQLQEKQTAIDRAQARLDGLEDDLQTTEQSVVRASRELERLLRSSSASLSPDGAILMADGPPQLTEAARTELRAALARKVNTVSQLQSDAELLRCQMDETESDMRRQQQDVDALRHQLSRLNQSEPLHEELHRSMVDKEQQLSDNSSIYQDLQRQMDELMETIKTEAEGVRDLEKRLQVSRAGQNDQMKSELEGVVTGLQDYLTNIRKQSEEQRRQIGALIRERDELQRTVDEGRLQMEGQMTVEKASRKELVDQLTAMDEMLEDERQANDELQTQLRERDEEEAVRKQEADAAEHRLATAEGQIGELKRALQRVRAEAQSDRSEMEAAMAAERRRLANDSRREAEDAALLDELEVLQRANADLQRQLDLQRRQLLSPRHVARRVRDMVADLRDGKPLGPQPDGDSLSRSLGQLAVELEQRNQAEGRSPSSKSEAEVQVLRSRMEKSGRDRVDSGGTDQSTQAQVLLSMIEDSKRTYSEEMTKMKEQIGRLQQALENVRSRPSQSMQLQSMLSNVEEEELGDEEEAVNGSGQRTAPAARPAPRQRVFTRRRAKGGPGGPGDGSTEEEDGAENRRPLLQWKKGLYDTLSSDELGMFEELNSELTRLRRQMENVEDSNAGKLEDALGKIRELQEEIQRRDEEIEAAERQRERDEWEKQLNNTFGELDQAQEQIMTLQQRLEDRERQLESGMERTDKSQETINTQHREISQLRDILDAQRQEIMRLNELLDRLSGLSPAAVNRMELERIQAEIGALRANVAAQTQPHLMPGMALGSVSSLPNAVPPQRYNASVSAASPAPRASPFVVPTHPPTVAAQPPVSSAPPPPQPQPPPQYPGVPPLQYSVSPFPAHVAHGFAGSPIHGYPAPVMLPAGSLPAMHPVAEEEESVRRERRRRRSVSAVSDSGGFLCNVPEHHQLEDYLQGLQDRIGAMKQRLKEKKRLDHEAELATIRRLRDEIEEKKDELEEMTLSLERQRAAFQRLQEQEKGVVDAARQEMERIKAEVNRSRREMMAAQSREAVEEAEAELEASAAQRQYLKDEIACLTETLAKRKAELVHAEKQLAVANSELTEVKTEARETIGRYDEARVGHERTVQEAEELERRSKEALTELARTSNDVRDLRAEVADLEASKRQLELTLNEVQQVIGRKDAEYQALSQKARQTAESLSKLQQDLSATMEQGREKLDLIHEEEQILTEKRAEFERVRQQTEAERAELEQLDRQMGRRRTEEQLLQEQLEKKREELAAVTRDAEKETAARQREIRDVQNTLDSLREEKKHLLKTIEDHKGERDQMRDDADREQQVLQNITSAISKQKMELKHLLEMIKLEQGELTKVNEQYAERLAALERAQTALHEQRAELAETEATRKRKSAEVERCREAVQTETAALERVQAERRSVEASVDVMQKEKEMLSETSKSLEGRTAAMKKTLGQLDDSVYSSQSRLDKLQSSLATTQSSLSQSKQERESLEKEVAQLSQQTHEAKLELKSLQERLHDYESRCEKAEQEHRQQVRTRDEVHAEVRRYSEQARAAQLASDEASSRSTLARDELQRVQHELSDRHTECQEASKNLSRLRRDVEMEESRLNRLTSNATTELDKVKQELALKQDELEACVLRLQQVKRDAEQRQLTEERALELSRRVADLEAEVASNNEEKQQLAEALNRSYKERQALREDCAKEREAREATSHAAGDEAQRLRQQLTETQRELKRLRKRSTGEIRELEKIAQEHCARSNRLTSDLNQARHDYLELRKQLMSQAELLDKKRRLEETLRSLKRELHPVNGMSHLPERTPESPPAPSPPPNLGAHRGLNGHALEELAELQDQRKLLQTHLDTLKDNLNNIRTSKSDTPPTLLSAPVQTSHDTGKLSLDADEEIVKAQIRQRVNEHMDALASEYRRSEDNMHSLRRRLDDLQTVLGQNGSPESSSSPSRDRSPFLELPHRNGGPPGGLVPTRGGGEANGVLVVDREPLVTS